MIVVAVAVAVLHLLVFLLYGLWIVVAVLHWGHTVVVADGGCMCGRGDGGECLLLCLCLSLYLR